MINHQLLKVLNQELFYFSFCLWLALILLEIILPNIVLAYFNINYLLVIVLFSGLALLIKNKHI